jgi:hypothetical protein
VVVVAEAAAVAVVAGALVTGVLAMLVVGVLIFDADAPVAVGVPGTDWFSNVS